MELRFKILQEGFTTDALTLYKIKTSKVKKLFRNDKTWHKFPGVLGFHIGLATIKDLNFDIT